MGNNIHHKFYWVIILVFSFFIKENLAQGTQGFSTDRPGAATSPVVIPSNTFQVEMGFNFQKKKYSSQIAVIEEDNFTLGQTLFRYGLDDKYELRFGGEYFLGKKSFNDNEFTSEGISGIFLGTKIQLVKDKNIINDLALVIEFGLPFGNKDFRPDKIEPRFVLSLGKSIIDKINFGLNVGSSIISGTNNFNCTYAVSFGFQFNDRLSAFAEYYGETAKNFLPSKNIDAGISYLQKENLQLDISFGSAVFNKQTDYFIQLGFSIGFQK